MKMSYRHAWELVDSMNRQSSKPLVKLATGGRNGGGAHLTKEGEKATVLFWELYADFQTYLKLQQKRLACYGDRMSKGRKIYYVEEKKEDCHSFNEGEFLKYTEFINWLISKEGQQAIGFFKDSNGNALFIPMQNNDIPLPELEKISKLISALRDYGVKSAREYWEEYQSSTYDAPSLASWDAFMWFELVQDWELVGFLISGTDKAGRLVRSLQSCLQWYGQGEIDEILERLRLMSMVN